VLRRRRPEHRHILDHNHLDGNPQSNGTNVTAITALPSGTTATTQLPGINDDTVATTTFVHQALLQLGIYYQQGGAVVSDASTWTASFNNNNNGFLSQVGEMYYVSV